jgi:hypothetical protein
MRSTAFTGVAFLLLAGVATAASIEGEYLEVRNANMWAGPCLANAEIGLIGNQATMAWKVTRGTFQNVKLDGLSIVAVVYGDRTFGVGDKVKTETLFIVDKQASKRQQKALVAMASQLAGETIQKVIAVKTSTIKMDVGSDNDTGYSIVDAGIAKVRTRRLKKSDNTCGTKERMAYPVLAKVSDEQGAYTLESSFTGDEFDAQYVDRFWRGGIIGKFSIK